MIKIKFKQFFETIPKTSNALASKLSKTIDGCES